MNASRVSFGPLLRGWRERRRMTQSDLALAAESSTRHLSCLETGKAQPSREMVFRLTELLEVPLRERNALLLAAGFAPAFRESAVEGLAAAKAAMERVLQAHKPYPAFAVDRHWNVVLSNGALPQLYEGCSVELLKPPVNAMRLILHPHGMGPRILNYRAWRAYSLGLLRHQVAVNADSALKALLAEIAAYPSRSSADSPSAFEGDECLATPLRISTRLGTVSFLNTLTVFGTANDITLAELALEMLFPADGQTIEIVRRMVGELARPLAVSELA
jgi:transcriptional regulator with XRE-family HTH domain